MNTGEYIYKTSDEEQNTDYKDICCRLFKDLRDMQLSVLNRFPSLLAPCYIYGVIPVNGPSKNSNSTRDGPDTTWRDFEVNYDEPANQSTKASPSALGDFLDLIVSDALVSSFGNDTASDFSMERLEVLRDTYHLSLESNDTA